LSINLRSLFSTVRTYGLRLLVIKLYRLFSRDGLKGLGKLVDRARLYEHWIEENALTEEALSRLRLDIENLEYRPRISVIVPVYNVEERFLKECIESVREQLYPHWELCIADDASTRAGIRDLLEEYARQDDRIKIVYREKNGHISAASNSALALAGGEFVALLDHDDRLAPEALYEIVKLLNRHPDADMIYSDEDKIDESGRRHLPFFKPNWSPDTYLSQNYTCHLGVYRLSMVREIGGFRVGYEGSQDYDLVLRLTEKTEHIYHLPKVLYHWRSIRASAAMDAGVKNYAYEAGLKALRDAVKRRGERAAVEMVAGFPGCYRVSYELPDEAGVKPVVVGKTAPTDMAPLVSIIIPTKDQPELLERCLTSVQEKSGALSYEIIVVDNSSELKETATLFERWQGRLPERFRVLRQDIAFNYSRLNNEAAKLARGELLLLLNNDTEVITADWLKIMAAQALRSSIGALGAKLLYPDGRIQHAGVIVGLGGVAGYGHRLFKRSSGGYHNRLVINANYAAVTGACLMVKRELYIEVGGLDEQLAVSLNDIDFCLKLLEKDYYNVVLPGVELYHHESKTRGAEDNSEKQQRFEAEIYLFRSRWARYIERDPFYNPNLTLEREDFSVRI
jgi:O-antigen biosynthesis protein